MIYEHFSLKKDLMSKGVGSNFNALWKVTSIINCEYGEKIGLVE
jgi:hypothetical protein